MSDEKIANKNNDNLSTDHYDANLDLDSVSIVNISNTTANKLLPKQSTSVEINKTNPVQNNGLTTCVSRRATAALGPGSAAHRRR